MACPKKLSNGIWTCANTAGSLMPALAWALSVQSRGSAGSNTCARPSPLRGRSRVFIHRTGFMTPETTAPVAVPTKTEAVNKQHLAEGIVPKRIRLLGIPLDLGQTRRGVDMGPSAVRVAGLEARLEAIGHIVEDGGNVSVAFPEQKKEGAARAKYLKEITVTCTKSAELVLKTLDAGKVPLVLGGDHSVAAGTVAGVAEFHRRRNQAIGLIWIDAHTDINTPDTSPSGNVHGMPLAAIMGRGRPERANIFDFPPKGKPENCVRVAIRDVDAHEKENIRKAGVE